MKRRWWVFVAAAAAFILVYALVRWSWGADHGPRPWDGPAAARDLDSIRADTFRVLVVRDPMVWEVGPDGDRGVAWEWLQRFAKRQRLVLNAVPMAHADSMLAALWEGRGDVIAAPMHLDRAEQKHFHRMEPFALCDPMLVRLRAEEGPDAGAATIDDAGDSLLVARASPFAHPEYEGWKHGTPERAISAAATEEDLMIEVLLGHRRAAIVSRQLAQHDAARFPALQFEGPLGTAVPWGLVVRRDAGQLRAALAAWQGDRKEREALDKLRRARTGAIPPAGPMHARRIKRVDPDSLSPFDDDFRAHAQGRLFDWRLLAAMAWKESRFDSTVTSRMGASGIMQMMPRTAARFGIDTASVMGDHIGAASRYLARLDTLWLRAIPDRHQRLRFVLASYNAGPGHIIDAQRLAARLGLDDRRWEGNVERAILLLAKPRYFLLPEMKNGYCKGSQVFHYVRGVLAVQEQLGRRPGKGDRK